MINPFKKFCRPKFIRIPQDATAPHYLSKDKDYEIVSIKTSPNAITGSGICEIIDDTGKVITTSFFGSIHIGGKNWLQKR